MSTLSTDLAARGDRADRDALAAAIQQDKRAEFHSLGLVLGYTYAGSAVVQPGPPPQPQDTTRYVPTAEPGARLPHTWVSPGSSLYDLLGREMTMVGPEGRAPDEVVAVKRRATQIGVPLTVVPTPPQYPWADDFFLVRPDQHIAWRAASPLSLDLAAAVGRTDPVPAARRPGPADPTPQGHERP